MSDIDPIIELRKALEESLAGLDAYHACDPRVAREKSEARKIAIDEEIQLAVITRQHLPAVLQRLADAEVERDELRARVKYTH